MNVWKTTTRKGKDGNGTGKAVSWSAIVDGKCVQGFATKMQAMEAAKS